MDKVFLALIGVLGILVGAPLAAYVTAKMAKPKVEAEASATVTESAVSLLPYQERIIASMEKRIETLENRVEKLEVKEKKLEEENEDLRTWGRLTFVLAIENGLNPPTLADVQQRRRSTD